PRRYVAYTACFRREHMSAGRDVRGIKRGHEFDKVEMVVHCAPEESSAWLDKMTALAVEVLEKLELPVRVSERCTGDLGFTAMRGRVRPARYVGPRCSNTASASMHSLRAPTMSPCAARRFADAARISALATGSPSRNACSRPSVRRASAKARSPLAHATSTRVAAIPAPQRRHSCSTAAACAAA